MNFEGFTPYPSQTIEWEPLTSKPVPVIARFWDTYNERWRNLGIIRVDDEFTEELHTKSPEVVSAALEYAWIVVWEDWRARGMEQGELYDYVSKLPAVSWYKYEEQ